jgi:hypothetical protein
MIRRLSMLMMLALLFIGLSGCDPAYPPYLRNGLPAAILMKITYTDGAQSEGTLQPTQRLVFARPKGDIKNITVIFDDRVLYNLSRKDLDDLLAKAPADLRSITWNIQTDGIKPLSQREIQKYEKK